MEQGWVHVVYGYPYESYIYIYMYHVHVRTVRELFFILVQLIYFSQKGVIFNQQKTVQNF